MFSRESFFRRDAGRPSLITQHNDGSGCFPAKSAFIISSQQSSIIFVMSTSHKQNERDGGQKTRSGVIVSLEPNGSALVGGALVQQGEPPLPVPPYLVNPVRHLLKAGDSVIYQLEFSPKQEKWCVVDLEIPDTNDDPPLGRIQKKIGSKGAPDPIPENYVDQSQTGSYNRRKGVFVSFTDSGRAALVFDEKDGQNRYIPKEAVDPVRSSLVRGLYVTYKEYTRNGQLRGRDLEIPSHDKQGRAPSTVLKPSTGKTATSNQSNSQKAQISSLQQVLPEKENAETTGPSIITCENSSNSNTHKDDPRPTEARQGRSINVNIGTDHDFGALNAALASPKQLPARLQEALGGTEIWIETNGTVMISRNWGPANIAKLRWFFGKHGLCGWSRWITGDIGWTLDASASKKLFIPYLRSCHKFYTDKMSELKKGQSDEMRRHLDILMYKVNGTMEGGIERQNTERLWTKVAKDGSLQEGVVKVRSFLEVLRYAVRKLWKEIPWLQSLGVEERQRRLIRVDRMVGQLLRSSEQGPDVPVHWAAHPPLSAYPRAVVTDATMTELVVELANILGNLFCSRFPAPLRNLQHVDAFLRDTTATDAAIEGLTDEFGRVVRIA